MDGIIEYLLANPIFLAPILLIAAMMLYAILKKLLKLAVILVIAGGLYALMLEYFGNGM